MSIPQFSLYDICLNIVNKSCLSVKSLPQDIINDLDQLKQDEYFRVLPSYNTVTHKKIFSEIKELLVCAGSAKIKENRMAIIENIYQIICGNPSLIIYNRKFRDVILFKLGEFVKDGLDKDKSSMYKAIISSY